MWVSTWLSVQLIQIALWYARFVLADSNAIDRVVFVRGKIQYIHNVLFYRLRGRHLLSTSSLGCLSGQEASSPRCRQHFQVQVEQHPRFYSFLKSLLFSFLLDSKKLFWIFSRATKIFWLTSGNKNQKIDVLRAYNLRGESVIRFQKEVLDNSGSELTRGS